LFRVEHRVEENNYRFRENLKPISPKRAIACKIQVFGDLEWGQRAHRKGLKIAFSEKTTVYHPARYYLIDLIKKHKRIAIGHSKIGLSDEISKYLSVNPLLIKPKLIKDCYFQSKERIKKINLSRFNKTKLFIATLIVAFARKNEMLRSVKKIANSEDN
jgi:hypothetical protein